MCLVLGARLHNRRVQSALHLCRGERGEETEASEHAPGFYSKRDLSPAQMLHGLDALSPCVHGLLAWGHLPHLSDLPLIYPGNWSCASRPGPGTLQFLLTGSLYSSQILPLQGSLSQR